MQNQEGLSADGRIGPDGIYLLSEKMCSCHDMYSACQFRAHCLATRGKYDLLPLLPRKAEHFSHHFALVRTFKAPSGEPVQLFHLSLMALSSSL